MPHVLQHTSVQRTAAVHVRCTPEEHDEITAKALATGLSISEYARRAMLEWEPGPSRDDRLDAIEARLGRLEEIANL